MTEGKFKSWRQALDAKLLTPEQLAVLDDMVKQGQAGRRQAAASCSTGRTPSSTSRSTCTDSEATSLLPVPVPSPLAREPANQSAPSSCVRLFFQTTMRLLAGTGFLVFSSVCDGERAPLNRQSPAFATSTLDVSNESANAGSFIMVVTAS
jgi:hypothetical protein